MFAALEQEPDIETTQIAHRIDDEYARVITLKWYAEDGNFFVPSFAGYGDEECDEMDDWTADFIDLRKMLFVYVNGEGAKWNWELDWEMNARAPKNPVQSVSVDIVRLPEAQSLLDVIEETCEEDNVIPF